MADDPNGYTPPATQEEFNRIIKERVDRANAKFADYSDLKAKAQRFDELTESQKNELQRAVDRAEKAEQQIAQFESERQVAAWKTEIAGESGVPVEALRGSTREDLAAHAEYLKPLLADAGRGPYVPNPGSTPSTPPASDERAFVRDLFGGP